MTLKILAIGLLIINEVFISVKIKRKVVKIRRKDKT